MANQCFVFIQIISLAAVIAKQCPRAEEHDVQRREEAGREMGANDMRPRTEPSRYGDTQQADYNYGCSRIEANCSNVNAVPCFCFRKHLTRRFSFCRPSPGSSTTAVVAAFRPSFPPSTRLYLLCLYCSGELCIISWLRLYAHGLCLPIGSTSVAL